MKNGYIFHVKLMLLRFEGFVRLVISSLNLSDTQWQEAGDSFWWADLPFCGEDQGRSRDCEVHQPLEDMLWSLCVPEGWLRLLDRCDWPSLQQKNTHVRMVTSIPIPVSSKGGSYGMPRLHRILKGLPKFPSSATSPVYVQVWSLGGASDVWYSQFARTLTQENYLGVIAQWRHDHVRFIFEDAGHGSNFQRRRERELEAENHYRRMLDMPEKAPRPSELKTAMWSEQHHLLLEAKRGIPRASWGWHSKVMTREYPPGFCKRRDCHRVHGWRYFGSHNCSRSCWGMSYYDKYVHRVVTEYPRNWEMGVVLASIPASGAGDECGVDLDIVAPLPFRKRNLRPSYPCARCS